MFISACTWRTCLPCCKLCCFDRRDRPWEQPNYHWIYRLLKGTGVLHSPVTVEIIARLLIGSYDNNRKTWQHINHCSINVIKKSQINQRVCHSSTWWKPLSKVYGKIGGSIKLCVGRELSYIPKLFRTSNVAFPLVCRNGARWPWLQSGEWKSINWSSR